MPLKMPMKVTVCFDTIRVTVPCGEGNFPVKELINKAIHRYKRAVSKSSNHWVVVTNLKTVSGGGILDPDDMLSDVVDDREQLIAEFDEHKGLSAQHIGGDGASASSTGTASPDFFTSETINEKTANGTLSIFSFPSQNLTNSNNAITDIVVTSSDLPIDSKLKIRHGSAPDLLFVNNQIIPAVLKKSSLPRRESVQDSDEPCSESSDEDKKSVLIMHRSLERRKPAQKHFSRGTLRASLSSHLDRHQWLEEQEKIEPSSKQSQERVGLLDGHDGYDTKFCGCSASNTVSLYNGGGPLGIHAVPYFDDIGKNMGLLIQSIELDRPVYKDGRIKSGDIVTEINGISLHDVPFQRAQDIFRAAKDTKEIHLKVVHHKCHHVLSGQNGGSQPQPLLPKPRSHTPLRPSPLTMPSTIEQNTSSLAASPRDSLNFSNAVNCSIQNKGTIGFDQNFSTSCKVKKSLDNITNKSSVERSTKSNKSTIERSTASNNSHIKKIPPKVPVRSSNTLLTGLMGDVPLNAVTNTKKIGKKIVINLIKGPTGLGFSVTSRDNQTDGNCPIYIRNILPKGAAVQDGQLRPGDRLLQVNGFEMTGKTQSDAVKFLRLIPEGSDVELVISRQEEVDEKFKVPRKMADNILLSKNGNSYGDNYVVDDGEHDLLPLQPVQNDMDGFDGKKEQIILHIPLNETGSAGLGVSVKGKTVTSESGSKDLGIFVKTVLQGGAAYKDGRLQVNDQLLEVNGVKLKGLSNASAMEALRLAMIQEGQIPGIISLTVVRHSSMTPAHEFSPSSCKSNGSSQSDSEIGAVLLSQTSSPSPEKFLSSSMNRAQRYSDSGPNLVSQSDIIGYNFIDHSGAVKIKHHVNTINKCFKVIQADSKLSTFQNKQRPHSATCFIHESEKFDASDDSNDDIQTSTDDIISKPLLPFEREGLGRQSMSEKRKGHLDPRNTEIYKIVKANKEIKGIILSEDAQNKVNSTEQEFQNENSWSNQHFGRGRACNDSFRAAVDRSYDIQDPALMDTLEEESIESGAYTLLSGRSSISSEMTEENNSLHRIKIKEKKDNLLKGFLRFGKGRKSQDEIVNHSHSEERSASCTDYKIVHNIKPLQTIDFIPISEPTLKASTVIQSSKKRYQPEFLNSRGHFRSHFVEPSNGNSSLDSQSHFLSTSAINQKWEGVNNPNVTDPRNTHPAALTHRPKITGNNNEGQRTYFTDYDTSSDYSPSEAIMSRAEYIQQLRTLYQHHHRQRHGMYPQEDTEELYERHLQELEQNVSSHRYMEEEIQNNIATSEKFYVKKTEELINSHQNQINKTFLYSGQTLRNSSLNLPSHDHQDTLTSSSQTQPLSYESSHYNVLLPAPIVNEQSYNPKMTCHNPSSQYMFPKSNPPLTDFNSAKV